MAYVVAATCRLARVPKLSLPCDLAGRGHGLSRLAVSGPGRVLREVVGERGRGERVHVAAAADAPGGNLAPRRVVRFRAVLACRTRPASA